MQAGTRLGPYQMTARIGAGGMGEVWRARDTRLDRDVAIKIIPDAAASKPDALQRFEQEARTAGSLNHPNLVTVHDTGSQNGTTYVVMELLDGETLRSKIGDAIENGGPALPVRKAIDYSVQIANGLAAAHEKGIIHRDLKPENIFITKDGRVKILDFGLAKLVTQSGNGNVTDARTQQRGTSPGTVMGTVGYMSPEQVRGRDVDHRTDIFALGAILYEMLSGRRAFRRDSAVETMNAILKEDPPELDEAHAATFAPGVERIIRRCLEKEPEERFQSAHDIAFALDAVSTSSSQRVIEAVGDGRRGTVVAAIGAAVVIAIAAIIAAWRAGARSAATTTATSPQPRQFVQLTFQSQELYPALSADGKTFAFVSDAAGNDDIYVQRVDGRNAINLTKDSLSADSQPAFSPDGSQIAFRSGREGGGIFVMGATGESVRRLTDVGFNPTWSPDGKEIAFGTDDIRLLPRGRTRHSELWVVSVRTGSKRRLTTNDAVQPSWSPHGDRIAYWGLVGETGQRDIWTIDPRAANPNSTISPVTDDAVLDWNPQWSPDGKWLYFGSDRNGTLNLWRVGIDEASGKRQGELQAVTVPSRFAAHFSIARNSGEIAFVDVSETETIWRVPFDPAAVRVVGQPVRVMSGALMLFDPLSYSPDGRWCTFSSFGIQEDVYVMRCDGSEVRQLTNDPEKDRAPAFSADGKLIYFYSQRGPRYEVWSIRPDGSDLRQVSHTTGRSLWYPQPLPNRNALYAFNEEGTFILPFNADGTITRQEPLPPMSVPASRLSRPAASPDGSKLAGFAQDASSISGIWTYSFATRSYDEVEAGTFNRIYLAWLPDGRVVLAVTGRQLFAFDTVKKSKREVPLPVPLAGAATRSFSISPNGRELQIDDIAATSSIWLMR